MSASSQTAPILRELDSAGIRELRERILARVLARLVRVRSVFGPTLLSFALWIVWVDPTPWRRIVLGILVVALAALVVLDGIVSRKIASGEIEGAPPRLSLHLLLIGFLQQAMVFATGGLASPVIPLLLPVAFITGVFVKPRLAWAQLLAWHLPVLWIELWIAHSRALELLPELLRGPMGGGPSALVLVVVAVVMSGGLVVSTLVGTRAAQGLDMMVYDALRSRDRALQVRTEQNRELSTLSAEIAHELKNPLASIKGLAQLVRRGLERAEKGEHAATAKASERMTVLAREVDRMQAILDEFLNFSRPLVPLSQREVGLRELVDHVVDLHEAMAGERRVELLVLEREPIRCVCDPRKVEQILINLVQNALEATDPGTRIELELGSAAELVELRVRDAGPGLAPELRAQVFELGVSDKATGSGIGLTVARAIARQHGGELELGARADGARGCEAVLSLPSQPARDGGETTHDS